MKIKNIWNHHLDLYCLFSLINFTASNLGPGGNWEVEVLPVVFVHHGPSPDKQPRKASHGTKKKVEADLQLWTIPWKPETNIAQHKLTMQNKPN